VIAGSSLKWQDFDVEALWRATESRSVP